MANPTSVPSNVTRPAQPQAPTASTPPSLPQQPTSTSNATAESVRIKAEPTTYDSPAIGQTNGIPLYGSSVAQQRAAHNLAQKFGSGANLQINQLQAQNGLMASGQQQSGLQNIQLPSTMSEQQKRDIVNNQARQLQSQQYQNLQQAQQRPGVISGQTDGADDWKAMVTERRAAASSNPTGNPYGGLTLMQQANELSQSLEGGGLMVPLAERPKPFPTVKHKAATAEAGSSSFASLVASQLAVAPRVARYDGIDDESEDEMIKDDPGLLDDEDAINSDLDDPDDNVVEEADEENQRGQIMLCTYDKVQRVKNKWKCTLKDGVLTTGGKE